MVHSAAMSGLGLWSFEDEIWQGADEKTIRRIPSGGEHSIAWIIWHITRIEDVTMNLLLAGSPQLLNRDGWFTHLQVPFRDTGNAMDEADVASLSSKIDIGALRAYRIAIGRKTREIVKGIKPPEFTLKVDPVRLKRTLNEGAVKEGAHGLLDYWSGLTHAGLLLMPPTRHNFVHLNEALRVKQKIINSGFISQE
jgi:hypothetical protein